MANGDFDGALMKLERAQALNPSEKGIDEKIQKIMALKMYENSHDIVQSIVNSQNETITPDDRAVNEKKCKCLIF